MMIFILAEVSWLNRLPFTNRVFKKLHYGFCVLFLPLIKHIAINVGTCTDASHRVSVYICIEVNYVVSACDLAMYMHACTHVSHDAWDSLCCMS